MNVKLEFSPNLYLGEGIKAKKLDKIKKKLQNKPLFAGVYIVTISEHPEEQLELFDAKQLQQKFYETHGTYVVGIAADYEDALKLIERIAKECLEKRGDCRLKEYLTC